MEKWAKSQNNKKSTFVAKKPSVVRTAVAAAAVFVPQVKSSFESVPAAIEEREEDKETEKEVAAEQVAESSPGAEQQSKVLIKYLTRQMLNVASLNERTTRIINPLVTGKKLILSLYVIAHFKLG